MERNSRIAAVLKNSIRVVAAVSLGCLAVFGAWTAAASSAVAHFTLANGLEVVVIPDRRAPVVTHMVWYKVGAADEPPGKSGIAHFLEHLMFKGTKKNPTGKFSKFVSTIGGQENAFTSSDYTGYYQRVARENLKSLMEFEADRMTGLMLTDEVVKPELNVILEEQNQRVGNNPGARLGEQVLAALYLNHPYGIPVIGWRHEMEKLTREDALVFYKRFYSPNNAVLVVAGDVSVDEVKKLTEQTYGKVERRAALPPRVRPQEPPPSAVRQVTLADPRVQQPGLQRSYLVPSVAKAKKGESEALDVLSHILGANATGRLYRILVAEKGIAVSAGAWYQGASLDMTRLGISATPRSGVSLPDLEDAIDDVVADVVARGVTADEIERAKTRLVSDFIFAQDNQTTLARWYGVALTTGSSVQQVRTWPDRIRSVTADDVHAVARTWLDKRRSVTGYLVRELRREEKRS